MILPYVIKFLVGKKVKEICDFGYEKLDLFGKGVESDDQFWNSVLRNALMKDMLEKDIEQYGVLKLTDIGTKLFAKATQNGGGTQSQF
jgi:ATP-dependent DNA helicase RecQ